MSKFGVSTPRVETASKYTHASVKGLHLKSVKSPKLGLTHAPKIKAPKKVSAKLASPLKMKTHL